MKKLLLALSLAAAVATTSRAVTACPDPFTVTQPDGSQVTLILHGDEFLNFTTTVDGYTVVRSEASGAWEYADLAGTQLIATGRSARNAAQRSADDRQFLSAIAPGIVPSPTPAQVTLRQNMASLRATAQPRILDGAKFDYDKFRGLVILIEYNDRPFMRDNVREMMDSMINQPGYSGYMNDGPISQKVEYTGSVRDYFSDNSGGRFNPKFDVVGPVKVNLSCTYANGTNNIRTLIPACIEAADPHVNFADYDTDGDGTVDMVYFIFAGAGSNFGGNNSSFIWPHASQTSGTRDGVRLGRYACSTELYGTLTDKRMDGIGTIVHEFSHVLGVADLYDTDYASSGGSSAHPGYWSVMASGSYNNMARTPSAYSAYERYANGFDTPVMLTQNGDYTLPYLGTSGKSYRINTPVTNEFFILENRQLEKWDAYLPGSGMLVFRVDSTDTSVWSTNKVNCDPKHNYYELLRANPKYNASNAIVDSPGDAFPGTGNVTSLGYSTTPKFTSWAGVAMPYEITDIREVKAGNSYDIHFTLSSENAPTLVEDFESMPLTDADQTGLKGVFTSWNLTGARVVESTPTCGSGSRALGMLRSSELTCAPVQRTAQSLSFEVSTPEDYGSTPATIQVYARIGAAEWSTLSSSDNTTSVMISRNQKTRLSYPLSDLQNAEFRIQLRTGSRTKYCYIDNLTVQCAQESSGIDAIEANASEGTLTATAIGGKIIVDGATPGADVALYAIDGSLVYTATADVTGRAVLVSARRGIYIVSQTNKSIKVKI